MKIIGLLLALCGWLIPVAGLVVTPAPAPRLVFCLVGIAMCLTGILGFLNRAYLREAIWKQ